MFCVPLFYDNYRPFKKNVFLIFLFERVTSLFMQQLVGKCWHIYDILKFAFHVALHYILGCITCYITLNVTCNSFNLYRFFFAAAKPYQTNKQIFPQTSACVHIYGNVQQISFRAENRQYNM